MNTETAKQLTAHLDAIKLNPENARAVELIDRSKRMMQELRSEFEDLCMDHWPEHYSPDEKGFMDFLGDIRQCTLE